MKTLARRSMQTIKNRTQIVSSFVDLDSHHEFTVRRLSERQSPERQLFIVTMNNKVHDEDVIPFAEIATSSSSKLRYVVNPLDQYPQLAKSQVLDRIETVIEMYMNNAWKPHIH